MNTVEFARYIRGGNNVLEGLNQLQIAHLVWQECFSKAEPWSITNTQKYLQAFQVAKNQLNREYEEQQVKERQEYERRLEAINKFVGNVLVESVCWVDECGGKTELFGEFSWIKKLVSTIVIGSSDPKKLVEEWAQCPAKGTKFSLEPYATKSVRLLAEEIINGQLKNVPTAIIQRVLGDTIRLPCGKETNRQGFKCGLITSETMCWSMLLTLKMK